MSFRLLRENADYVFQALTNLGERVRREGESALLDLPTILEEIYKITPKQRTRFEQDREEMLEERRRMHREAGLV